MANSVLFAKASKIKMLLLDVDGVMTNGQILLTPEGEELKFFSIHDGYGMVCAMRAGIRLGIISGRSSQAIKMRCDELNITDLYMNTMDKLPVFQQILEKHSLQPDEVAYVGDDVPDLPVLLKAGLSAAPQNGHQDVKKQVDLVLKKSGGDGAVRELIDFILLAQRKRSL